MSQEFRSGKMNETRDYFIEKIKQYELMYEVQKSLYNFELY